ncbi:MAG: hypothetical protein ACRDLQ_05805 [Solirubrobacterales bacterium]
MKRLTLCLAFLLAMGGPGIAQAPAASFTNLVGVDLVSPPSPPALVDNPFINSHATVTGDDSADSCLQRHLDELQQPLPQLPVRCDLVSYVLFWVDLPHAQIRDPRPAGGCPPGPTACQFMAQDDLAPYSLVERYNGPNGRHTATAQVWRYVWGDAQPVLLGQDSKRFCLHHCKRK